MVRSGRIALRFGNLVGRATLGFVGLLIAAGAFLPPAELATQTRPEPGEPAQAATTVTLRIPEGELAGHVTVVDATGRELAMVTRWYNGDIHVLARRDAGVGVVSFLDGSGSAQVRVVGSERETGIDAQPDGTASVTVTDIPPEPRPPGVAKTTGRGFPNDSVPSMLGSISDIRH